MNTISKLLLLVALVALAIPTSLTAQDSAAGTDSVKVGVFDSRCVAMAFYRSQQFNDELKEMYAGLEAAKKSGDEEAAREAEARGIELQDLMHKQGFGTWPIDNILKRIDGQLPGVTDKAGVDLIVSKWHVVYRRDKTVPVDVTDQLAALFEPDEATLKLIEEIRSKDPVPHDQLTPHQ